MEKTKTLFNEHLQFIVVIIAILGAFVWVRSESRSDYRELSTKIESISKDVNTIKTILIMKNIMPTDLADNGDKDKR